MPASISTSSSIITPPISPYPLLPLIQRVFPNVQSYKINQSIIQDNAQGFCIQTTSAVGTTATTTATTTNGDVESQNDNHNSMHLFIKCVEASNYAHKPWSDLRRTLLYSRTEARFYSEILPLLLLENQNNDSIDDDNNNKWSIAPICYLSESNLDQLIHEDESTSAKPSSTSSSDPIYDVDNTSILLNKGGTLILQSLQTMNNNPNNNNNYNKIDNNNSDCHYYQTSPLTLNQTKQCLITIAKFHATSFQNSDILYKVSHKLCTYGGSYHLKNRNTKELMNIKHTWNDFLNNLRSGYCGGMGNNVGGGNCKNGVSMDILDREDIQNIGVRIFDIAEYVSNELSPLYNDDYATIVHGDFKAMNIFLPMNHYHNDTDHHHDDDNDSHDKNNDKSRKNKQQRQPLLIDFASSGVGIGLSDVAMLITHAVHPDELNKNNNANEEEEKLIMTYLEAFRNALPPSKQQLYSNDVAIRHYRLATVDYFRFVLGRLWRGASLETFEKKKHSKNAALVSRNVDAALAFIERVNRYLVDIEKEVQLKGNK